MKAAKALSIFRQHALGCRKLNQYCKLIQNTANIPPIQFPRIIVSHNLQSQAAGFTGNAGLTELEPGYSQLTRNLALSVRITQSGHRIYTDSVSDVPQCSYEAYGKHKNA